MADVERFEFIGGGGQPLSGRIHMPAVEPIACAVFAHCFTCSKDSRAATYIGAALAENQSSQLRRHPASSVIITAACSLESLINAPCTRARRAPNALPKSWLDSRL